MDKPKRGDRFIHARFLDKDLKPQIREVTAVRRTGEDILVYHKSIGASKADFSFRLSDEKVSVKSWLNE